MLFFFFFADDLDRFFFLALAADFDRFFVLDRLLAFLEGRDLLLVTEDFRVRFVAFLEVDLDRDRFLVLVEVRFWALFDGDFERFFGFGDLFFLGGRCCNA